MCQVKKNILRAQITGNTATFYSFIPVFRFTELQIFEHIIKRVEMDVFSGSFHLSFVTSQFAVKVNRMNGF